MIKNLLVVVLICFSGILFAQDSIYVSKCFQNENGVGGGGSNIEIRKFDSNGHLISLSNIVHYDEDGISGSYGSYVDYAYDNSGNLIQQISYASTDSGSYILNNSHSYTYDLFGNRISDTLIAQTYGTVTTWDWDSNNNIVGITTYNLDSAGMAINLQQTIVRDGMGRPIENYTVNFSSGQPNYQSRFLTSYDSFGNVIEVIEQTGSGTTWVNSKYLKRSYTPDNLIEAVGNRLFVNGSTWTNVDSSYFQYNANLQNILQIRCNYNGFTIRDSTILQNVFDVGNRLIKIDYVHYFNGNINDGYRIFINRNASGLATDSLIQNLVQGVYVDQSNYLFDYSNYPIVTNIYEVACSGGSCSDTISLQRITINTLNHSSLNETYDVYHSGIALLSNSFISFNSSGLPLLSYSNYLEPGEQNHAYNDFTYDINGNKLTSIYISSGHAGSPVHSQYCYYSWIIDSGNPLKVDLYLTDTASCTRTYYYGSLLITGGTPPYTISWNDTTNIFNSTTLLPIFYPDSSADYILTVTDSVGMQIIDTVLLGRIIYSAHLQASTSCILDTIRAFISPVTPPYGGYYLYKDGVFLSSIYPLEYIAQSSGLYTMQFYNCGSTIYSDSIIINSSPTLNLGADRFLCRGDSILLNVNSTDSLFWDNGSSSHLYLVNSPGTIWCTAINGNNCRTTDSIEILSDQSSLLSLGNDTIICVDQTLSIDAGAFFTTYEWQDGSNNQFYSYSSSIADTISAHVIVTASNGCIQTDSMIIVVDNCAGINSASNILETIGPNPCNDFINIYVKDFNKECLVTLTNMSGLLLLEKRIFSESNRIDINLPSGIYILTLNVDGKIRHHKIIRS